MPQSVDAPASNPPQPPDLAPIVEAFGALCELTNMQLGDALQGVGSRDAEIERLREELERLANYCAALEVALVIQCRRNPRFAA